MNRADRKNCGASLGISQKSRNSRRVSGGEIGAKVAKGANWRSPGTKYKRSKNEFAITPIASILVPLGTKLLELPVVSNRESQDPGRLIVD